MHGYFMSLKLYSTARLIANPHSYAEHREKLLADRLAAKAESRIRAKKEQPKVNKVLAERLRRAEEKLAGAAKRKALLRAEKGQAEVPNAGDRIAQPSVLEDPRFKEVFENPEFEVDEDSREFALLNPATAANQQNVSHSPNRSLFQRPGSPKDCRGGRGRCERSKLL